MNRHPRASRVPYPLFAGLLLASIACRTNPTPTTSEPGTAGSTTTPATTPNKPAEIANEFTVSAQVLGVAPETRTLSLRREDGTSFDVVADANVRNFDQIEVGDVLRVRYRESLKATRLPPGEPMRPAEATLGAGRAPVGAKPAGAAGWAVSTRVRVELVDPASQIVVFSLPSGELVAHKVQTAEGREFIKGLKVADLVQLDYAEGVAIGIEAE